MATTPKILKPEYTNFTTNLWKANESWTSLAVSLNLAESQARVYFWEKVQESVLEALDKLRIDGWEAIEPIGPQVIKLRRSYMIDFSIDPSDVFLWFMTLGIAFMLQLILNRPRLYVTFRPVEIRIRLSRLKHRQRLTAA